MKEPSKWKRSRLNNELATIKNIVNANIDQRKEQLESEQSAIDTAFENKLISEQEYNAKLKELSTQRIAISQEEFDLVVNNVTKIRDSFVNVVSEAGKNLDYQQQLLKQSYDQGLITQDEYNKQSEELSRKKAVQERNLALFNLAIDTGVAIAGIVRQASRNPTNLTAERISALLSAWKTARQSRSTAFLNADVDLKEFGFDPKSLQLAEARQYVALELARASESQPTS